MTEKVRKVLERYPLSREEEVLSLILRELVDIRDTLTLSMAGGGKMAKTVEPPPALPDPSDTFDDAFELPAVPREVTRVAPERKRGRPKNNGS